MSSNPRPRPDTGSALERTGWPAFLVTLSSRSVGITIAVAVAVAVLLNPIFITPFTTLLGRTLFVGMMLLLVFAAARLAPESRLPHWLPRGLVPVTAVALAAPLFTAAVYVISSGGDIGAFIGKRERVSGFLWIAGSAAALGLVMAAAALMRERLAEAERRALALELERSRLEKQSVDAQLSLLQAQIEPHFLFNTLANVQALVESNSPRAADVLKSLIAYLRAAMPRLHDQLPTLGNELALVSAYLELMQMRMPDRLSFALQVDGALRGERFPSMALLTLVENAVRHGVDPSEQGGHIEVGAAQDTDGLRVWVSDSGVGMAENAQPGTGLSNLRARIAAFFGPGAELRLSEHAPHGLHAEIYWPRR
ncbi:MAG TPA: histidine kinase [Rubrivivax sp.]|nr:histidine kinase [Rubrivivax sp.]